MNIIEYPLPMDYPSLCERPHLENNSLSELIESVFSTIAIKRDKGLIDYTFEFENRIINQITYSREEIRELANQTDKELIKAINIAYANIQKFHESQITKENRIETSPGVTCWQKSSPIEKIGIYIPGGTAPLFSTVLMLAIPAQIAGCKEIILCTPGLHPALFYAAQLCGVTQVNKVGGAQAIAALAIGTESIPKVYKIFGPGNQYVTAAKMFANQLGVAIDMPAGPSELAIFADKTANPIFVAADLLSQAEHGIDSQVVLISDQKEVLEQSISEIKKQLKELPRKELATKALENSTFILVASTKEAIDILNLYAAEHLIIATDDPEKFANQITNAGSIFLGHYAPESAGDYASGTNHTLPTNGFAKVYSGVNLDSFTKKITFQSISPLGITNLGQAIITMAEAESLQAHANAVKVRLVK